jgi:hypothetical protein
LEEKLATMEQIWDDLFQHQNVQSPDWHGDVLQIREENRRPDMNNLWTGKMPKMQSVNGRNEYQNPPDSQ